MQFSHSRVDLFKQCPYRYQLRYIDKLKTLLDDDPQNALHLGTALHTGIEKGVKAAVTEYYANYPIITDDHVTEAIKLEYLIPKVKDLLPEHGIFEKQILTSDFIGYMDMLVKVDEVKRRRKEIPVFDLYDFKYSNADDRYKASGQLSEYKYFFEQSTGFLIRDMYFVMVPKVQPKRGQNENLYEYRLRIIEQLKTAEPHLLPVEYEPGKVIEFMTGVKHVLEAKEYPPKKEYLCRWCDYQKYCETGEDYMILPNNKRRTLDSIKKKTIWIYGAPFSGKTTLANQFPDPLMLNTDGNIKFVDAPYIPIKNDVTVEGRRTVTTLAWDVFKDAISELEKKDNDFKTIVVDLLEDTYEHCRLWCYDKLNIEHEADNSFKAWDYVRTQYLSTLKRLMNLDYENIVLISHEDTTKDVTKKSGDKITSISPNLQPKTATKVAGMVDIVARVIADGDERTLNFKTNEVIFGGGRLKVSESVIPLDFDALMSVYDEASENLGEVPKTEEKTKRGRRTKKADPVEAAPPEETEESTDEETEEKPKRTRNRRTKTETEETEPAELEPEDAEMVEEIVEEVKTRRGRRRTKPADPEPEVEEETAADTEEEEKPKRTRRTRKADPEPVEESEDDGVPFDVDEEPEETPKRTRRTRKARD